MYYKQNTTLAGIIEFFLPKKSEEGNFMKIREGNNNPLNIFGRWNRFLRMKRTPKLKGTIKQLLLAIMGLLFLVLAFALFCNFWVTKAVAERVFEDISKLPRNDVALVLGTNPRVYKNIGNPYFEYRIEAAHALYSQGKVKHLILSGDNGDMSYNEPVAMQKALIKRGIPESAITLDYAGFRTLDSVVRCKEIFQQQKVTIVSQQFHNYRAVFIATAYAIDAVAFNASEPIGHEDSKTLMREYLARCKAVLDLYVLNKQPKYLGEKIDIEIGE